MSAIVYVCDYVSLRLCKSALVILHNHIDAFYAVLYVLGTCFLCLRAGLLTCDMACETYDVDSVSQ